MSDYTADVFKERDELRIAFRESQKQFMRVDMENTRLRAENEKLRAAKVELLRLFDEAMDGYADCMPYKGYYLIGKHGDKENFDDLRAAAAALKEMGDD